ncbi:hypothetical protein PG997_007851 [Apiospora hydei]|uniref:Secreted protein n=1 Tax=Apiospora hydei TaxID=1337664 RepID=A0ABR1W974_9PEZI
MQFIFALVFFLLGLSANAATFNDIISTLPNGGYQMDMESASHGILDIMDVDGNPVKGSPFVIDVITAPAPVVHDPDPNANQTKDQWGNCHENGAGWFLQGSGDKTYGRGIKGGRSDPMTVCSNLV